MKRSILFLSLVLFIGQLAYAQKGVHLGVEGAFNSVWIVNQNNYGTLDRFSDPLVRKSELAYKYKFGYHVGAQFLYNFGKSLGLQVETFYYKGGQNYEDNMQEGPGRINVKRFVDLSYVQIPISFKYIAGKRTRVKFYTNLGLQFGFLVSRNEKVLMNNVLKVDSSGLSVEEKFKNFDIGIQFGLGTHIYCTEHIYFSLGFSSYYGLRDLNGAAINDLDWFSKNDVQYQRSHNFRAGLQIGLHYSFANGRDHYAAVRKKVLGK